MKRMIAFAFALLVVSCSENNPEPPQTTIQEEFRDSQRVLATVNNIEINETDFNIYKRAISISQPNLTDDQILEKLIEFELVSQKAKQEGLDRLPEIDSKIHLQANEFLSDVYIQRMLNSASDEVLLLAEYEKLKAENGSNEILLRHIMTDTRFELEGLLRRLEASSFEQVANIHNQNELGGLVGWVTPNEMIEPIRNALFNLAVNQTSGIIESDFGYHLIRVDEVRTTEFIPFEMAKNDLRSIVVNRKLDQLINQLKTEAEIERTADFSVPLSN